MFGRFSKVLSNRRTWPRVNRADKKGRNKRDNGERETRKTHPHKVRNRARGKKISYEFVSDFGYHVRSRLAEIFYDFVVHDISRVRLQV